MAVYAGPVCLHCTIHWLISKVHALTMVGLTWWSDLSSAVVPYRQIINKLDRALGTHLPRSHKKK